MDGAGSTVDGFHQRGNVSVKRSFALVAVLHGIIEEDMSLKFVEIWITNSEVFLRQTSSTDKGVGKRNGCIGGALAQIKG